MCLVCSAACIQYPLKGLSSTSLSTAHSSNWQSYPSLQQGPTPTIKSHSNHRAVCLNDEGRHLEREIGFRGKLWLSLDPHIWYCEFFGFILYNLLNCTTCCFACA